VASLSKLGVKGVALFLCLNKITRRMPAIICLSYTSLKTVVSIRLFICIEQSTDK
jgi:hypothetical protein